MGWLKRNQMGAVILFIVVFVLEHPIVSTITKVTIDVIRSVLKDQPLWAGLFIAAFVIGVILAILKEFRGAVAAGVA